MPFLITQEGQGSDRCKQKTIESLSDMLGVSGNIQTEPFSKRVDLQEGL
jgi:hypothetical protein